VKQTNFKKHMKKTHIFGLIIIAIMVAILVSTGTEAGTYSNFSVAEKMAKDGDGDAIHVIGKLKKDASGQILGMQYDPIIDANHLEFFLVDEKGREQKVVYNQPKPQDMEHAEQLVIIGKMEGQVFKCQQVITKCPSKYQDGKVDLQGADKALKTM
jgi:cytochrome c-type biogenesis protein CcmE